MKNKIIVYILLFATLLIPVAPALAAIKDWNEKQSAVTQATGSGPSTLTICEQLFQGDPNNIFREIFCSLINIIALSIADFSTDLTCKIQETGYSTNYVTGVSFNLEESTGKCITDLNTIPRRTQLTSDIISGPILEGFKIARGIMTILAVSFLFFLAFANILHIDINTYSVKRTLPILVVAVIGGYLSIYIVFLLSVIADLLFQLEMFSPKQALHPMFNIFGGYLGKQFIQDVIASATTGPQNSVNLVFETGKVFTSGTKATFISGFVGSFLLLIPAIATFVFEYVLALRPFIIRILAIASPFAFAALILPQTQFIFRKWWSYLLIAIFYAPIVNFIFYVLNGIPTSNNSIVILTLWGIKIVAIAFLVRLPFTIESDLKKIAVRLAKTGFGSSVGLNKIIKSQPKQLKTEFDIKPDQKLSAAETQGLIAPTKIPFPASAIKKERTTRLAMAEPLITNIKDILREAHQANLKRSADLLIKSASDIPDTTIREIMQNSDLKVWRDKQTLDQLKNKNGQILNETGAALRADSVRKLVRLSEVVDNNRLTNPQAIRFLSQKRVLDQLPLYILKKAFDDKIIDATDIEQTFGPNSSNVISRLNQMSSATSFPINSKNVAKIIDTDQKDFSSGFKDIQTAIRTVLDNPDTIQSNSGKNILNAIKGIDKNAIDQNGLYYLERLGQQSRAFQQQISKILQTEGIPPQTANAISQNTNVVSSNIDQYLNGKNLSDNTKKQLEQNFIARNLTGSIASEIASSVSAEKSLIHKAITAKISDSLKQGQNLENIKTEVRQAVERISKPISPDEAQKNIEKINQYYPGAQIRVGQEPSSQDIEKTAQRGKSILETIANIEESGINEEEIKTDLPTVGKKIEGQVNSTIRKVASGAIASDSAFDAKLKNISTKQ